jgi:hypothetical protein
MPFLKTTILRQLEELPNESGVSRTEHQILTLLQQGVTRPPHLFRQSQQMEEAVFMGDWSFYMLIHDLGCGSRPLVSGFDVTIDYPLPQTGGWAGFKEAGLILTPDGQRVLQDEHSHSPFRHGPNSWDRFQKGNPVSWHWDRREKSLKKQ